MAIDLDLFCFQLSDLEVADWLFEGSIRSLKEEGHLREGVLCASSGIPGPPEDEALAPDLSREARTARRLREMLSRTTYVFAFACLEHLLRQCVQEVFKAEPQRVLAIGDWWRDERLIRQQIVEGWTRERVVAEVVDAAVHNYDNQPFIKVPDYFEKRLDIVWRADWRTDLLAVANKRNAAAHDLAYSAPQREDIETDLRAVLEHGESIARAVAARYHLELRSSVIDEMRHPTTDDDGV